MTSMRKRRTPERDGPPVVTDSKAIRARVADAKAKFDAAHADGIAALQRRGSEASDDAITREECATDGLPSARKRLRAK